MIRVKLFRLILCTEYQLPTILVLSLSASCPCSLPMICCSPPSLQSSFCHPPCRRRQGRHSGRPRPHWCARRRLCNLPSTAAAIAVAYRATQLHRRLSFSGLSGWPSATCRSTLSGHVSKYECSVYYIAQASLASPVFLSPRLRTSVDRPADEQRRHAAAAQPGRDCP